MDIRNNARNKVTIGGPVEVQKVKNILCKIGLHAKAIINIGEGGIPFRTCSRCGIKLK